MTTVFIFLFISKFADGLLVTNAPIFISRISPILYHEACFTDRACLERSSDGVLYVSCNDCKNQSGVEIFLNNCYVPSNETVGINSNCTILGGFCASVVDENRYVCVPAVPFDGSWWPEAIPSPSQKCREKCGVDRAYFKRWNKTGGYERNCLCTAKDELVKPIRRLPTILDNRDIRRLLYRDPFPFCYFEQCSSVVDYGSSFLHGRNFSNVYIGKRSDVLAVGFKSETNVSVTECSTVNLPHIFDDDSNLCLDQTSYLFLHPQHLPDSYYERKTERLG